MLVANVKTKDCNDEMLVHGNTSFAEKSNESVELEEKQYSNVQSKTKVLDYQKLEGVGKELEKKYCNNQNDQILVNNSHNFEGKIDFEEKQVSNNKSIQIGNIVTMFK